jgi:small subunit ribosomal protein S13
MESRNEFSDEKKKIQIKRKMSESHESKQKSEQSIPKSITRIAATDIPGHFTIYHGLTKIKGISWSFSNAICQALSLDKKRKIGSLTESEIEKITDFLQNPKLVPFLLNRRFDLATGKNRHLITSELELQREFDIRNLKKIRSYKGWRHALGQPVRGQRTRSHFRKGRSIGVQRTKVKQGKV